LEKKNEEKRKNNNLGRGVVRVGEDSRKFVNFTSIHHFIEIERIVAIAIS
jgi:hypothetical protein